MTTHLTAPALEGQHRPASGPHDAQPALPAAAVGDRQRAARQGVRSALPSTADPQSRGGRYPIAWLHISAPRGATPTAHSMCECGWNHSAIGHRRVLALITAHTTHRERCPLRNPHERRPAA